MTGISGSSSQVFSPEMASTLCEVNKFWQEIKEKFGSEEFEKDWKQNYCGINVVYFKQ